MYQYHLNAKNCSGRGVRVRMLSPDECDRVLLSAAKEVGGEATVMELQKKKGREAVKAMIVEVTKNGGLSPDELMTADWMKVDVEKLEDAYSKLFNAKDDQFLQFLYRDLHEVTVEEVEQIQGKGLSVASP